MTAKDMQYDVRMKLNKLDSQKYRELRPQEVDWKLNEAQLILIKKYHEMMKWDSIAEVVITEEKLSLASAPIEDTYRFKLPEDFMDYISGHVLIQKNDCYRYIGGTPVIPLKVITEVIQEVDDEIDQIAPPPPPPMAQIPITVRAELIPKSHIDIHVDSILDGSSFEWRQVNYNFAGGHTPQDKYQLLCYSDGTFKVLTPHITYVRLPYRIVSLDSYKLPNGQVVTYQDCELHKDLHNELVDLAVLIASQDLQMKDIQLKEKKVKLN